MIFGAHAIIYSTDADADRAFYRDVLGLPFVDAGDGWLVFELPPAELALHPGEAASSEIYLMCDDLDAQIGRLGARGVRCSPVRSASWGASTRVALPSGADLGLYQPSHPTPHGGAPRGT